MTREELIEVIRNELWRQVFARDENAETMEYQKQVWDYDWERTLPKAKAMLSALEAAGVRLVPVEELEDLLAGPASWLNVWADHVRTCWGGDLCTCGLTLARHELAGAREALAAIRAMGGE